MPCCQCQGIEVEFGRKAVAADLKRLRTRGPAPTTRALIEALRAENLRGMTLLDIGGGVGAIQLDLLKAGVASATSVEASMAYVETAKEEAARQGVGDRVRHSHGDFVALASDIAPADIVTLDRVVCCYPDMSTLVGLSVAKARRLYGLVYPRDTWWNRVGLAILNVVRWLRGNPFRVFVHSPQDTDALIRRSGLQRRHHRQTLVWQVVVYVRPTTAQ